MEALAQKRNASKTAAAIRGRRVIELELDVLATALDSGCRACGKALQLSNCHDETISGLGSFLYIMCSDPECGEVNA